MDTRIEERDREFVRTLQQAGPASVAELCSTLGVTATSVRQRLARLQSSGFVAAEQSESQGRGRPVHQYRVTSDGLRALGSNYSDLAVLLWSEVSAIEHQPTKDQLFANLRSRLVERFGIDGENEKLATRVEMLATTLGDSGLDVGVGEQNGLPILKGCSCPYPDISQQDDTICQLETEVFASVLGADVALKQRCVDGHSCCEFAVSEKQ